MSALPPSMPDAAVDPRVLHDRVLSWYDEHARDLPWRAPEATPWGILVSEAMLQQTPVARVLPVWVSWMQRWPAPADLVAAGAGEAVRAWGRLGYPRRALRLHAAATAIVEHHNGKVPDDHQALLALPGVGAYTASAVAAFAFGRRHAVLDTNVRRVLGRVLAGEAAPGASISRPERDRAVALLPEQPSAAAAWAVGVMELGALVCKAVGPRCAACPVHDLCRWVAVGQPTDTRPRRVQGYAGTDRHVRGRLLAVLRESAGPVSAVALEAAWDEPVQRRRCLASLLDDGLAVSPAAGVYALP